VTVSFIMSVHPSTWKNLVPSGHIFMQFDIYFLKICQENLILIKI